MKRYSTIDWINGADVIDYSLPVKEFDVSLTDKSHFIPMAESVKRLRGVAPLSADVVAMSYDFPDGKDTGNPVPSGRRKGIDIAELVVDVRKQSKIVVDGLVDGAKNASLAADVDASLNRSMSNTSNSPISKT